MTDDAMLEPAGIPAELALAVDPTPVAAVDEMPPAIGVDASPADATDRRVDDGDASLLALVDRLARLLERSDLVELEVEAGATALVLRKPSALGGPAVPVTGTLQPPAAAAPSGPGSPTGVPQSAGAAASVEAAPAPRPSVKAPLTGIWYTSPAPGSAPYVRVGGEVVAGQVIGLIEAMKLFNEIKSDLSGRVVRVLADSGALVKAKQPLVEVEPL